MPDKFDAALGTPIARRKDPSSSHRAASEVTASGKRRSQMSEVLLLVNRHPGKTSLELSCIGDLDRYVIARRLPELETGRLIRRGGQRICTEGKRTAVTWFPLDEEERRRMKDPQQRLF